MKHLRIHCFQHEPYEDIGCIHEWIKRNGHSLTYTRFFEKYTIPGSEDYDWLIVMGGPMGVYQENEFPWIIMEKEAIRKAIGLNKSVIGICLGSQLIASALGADVHKNKEKEIGWFDITLTDIALKENLFGYNNLQKLKVFHWHGDTFSLPKGARHLAFSEATENQAFIYKENVIGLQFHFEVTEKSLKEMIDSGLDEIIPGKYVQSENELFANNHLIESNNLRMFQILDYLNK